LVHAEGQLENESLPPSHQPLFVYISSSLVQCCLLISASSSMPAVASPLIAARQLIPVQCSCMNPSLSRGRIPGLEPPYFRDFGRGFLSCGHNQSRKEYLSKLIRTALRISSSSTSNSSSNFFLWLTSICIFLASSLFIPAVFKPPSLEAGRDDMVSALSTG